MSVRASIPPIPPAPCNEPLKSLLSVTARRPKADALRRRPGQKPSGHPEAGQRSAVIYSVLGSCRRLGINPAEYLQEVFERLPKAKTSEIKSLTPSAWLKAKRDTVRRSA